MPADVNNVDAPLASREHVCILPTPAQIRAARALLNWTAQELADRAGLARMTVVRLEDERDEKSDTVSVGVAKKVTAAWEAAWIVFFWPDFQAGEGVRRNEAGPRYHLPKPVDPDKSPE